MRVGCDEHKAEVWGRKHFGQKYRSMFPQQGQAGEVLQIPITPCTASFWETASRRSLGVARWYNCLSTVLTCRGSLLAAGVAGLYDYCAQPKVGHSAR
jgi:hypothetical protein